MKIALILRGISGSGKSTVAQAYKNVADANGWTCSIHSTDQYFVGENGVFDRDPSRLAEYHEYNLRDFILSLEEGMNLVICDNTNIRLWEFEKYVAAAKNRGYEVQIQAMPHLNSYVAAKRNVHRVPEAAIRWQLNNWEN